MDNELEYQDELTPFMDVVERIYAPKDQQVWRWCHYPVDGDDYVVQAENPLNVPNIVIDDATEEEKIDYIERYALSAFTTLDNAVAAYLEIRERRVAKKGEQEGIKFDNQKGGHVQPIHVKPEHGVSDNPSGEHGHVNILTYKGVNPKDMAVGDPIPIVKQDSQDNKNDGNAL